jgi:TfoX/Sxy family transcriptional regulator of competence genes
VTEPAPPDERFERLVAAFAGRPGVAVPGEHGRHGFGSSALTAGGSIFAMLSRGRLVVKLPRARVAELIASGQGAPFDAGKGRPMKEWLVVAGDDQAWKELSEEALSFVTRAPSHHPDRRDDRT